MAIEVLMPAMSATVRVGRLARWMVKPGELVRPGDILAEIETATATMEVEAVDGGRIARLLVAPGTDAVAADTPIALIEPDTAGYHTLPHSTRGVAERELERSHPELGAPIRRRIKASPLARKRARAQGIALDELRGSGPGGRIIARDVAACEVVDDSAGHTFQGTGAVGGLRETPVVAMRRSDNENVASRQLAPVGVSSTSARDEAMLAREAYAPGSYIARSHDPLRHALLDRLAMAHTHVPQLALHADVLFDELERALERMNRGLRTTGRRALSLKVSDILIKAMGLALRQVPEANASFTRSAMLYHGAANVAVALLPDLAESIDEDRKSLAFAAVAPVIAHADLKSLSEISEEVQALREMAEAGNLDPSAICGGATTIYDLSRSVVSGCETLVMPPQSSVLAIGAAQAKAVVADGSVAVRACARMSLMVDQRAIDAPTAMRLLAAVKAYVEDPMSMLV